ncbi:MAG: signal recognition particle-docking protein FtsY [Chloroflexi bacterium]|nr:MAG: signal recognition particle-docking protein FtsY [Chloroflexota bacterium]
MFGIFQREKTQEEQLEKGLQKTRRGFFGRIAGLLGPSDITDETWDELEALLIQADVGVNTAIELVEELREEASKRGLRRADEVKALLKSRLVQLLEAPQREHAAGQRLLTVILIVGVNGSGKTTSIAKLAKMHKDQGRNVILVAGDTFRAAAIEQLQIWADRVGVPVIASKPGADPGAVVFDALRAGIARKADVVIIDTAGRLQTKYNLMEELKKIRNICRKQVHRAPHETLLVLDATTGQNALSQAKAFKDAVDITGVILAKLDGTAKGGMAFAVAKELGLPIQFVGTGETIDDFAVFDAHKFVDALFEEE